MNKNIIILSLSCLIILVGCGGMPRVVLKSPIQSKCEEANLNGCEDLTEGALLMIEGKKKDGAVALAKGAAKNAPKQLQQFASLIEVLKNIPGAKQFAKPLANVATELVDQSHVVKQPRSAILDERKPESNPYKKQQKSEANCKESDKIKPWNSINKVIYANYYTPTKLVWPVHAADFGDQSEIHTLVADCKLRLYKYKQDSYEGNSLVLTVDLNEAITDLKFYVYPNEFVEIKAISKEQNTDDSLCKVFVAVSFPKKRNLHLFEGPN